MKKLIVLAIIAVMLVFMTGCSNEKPSMENHYDTTIEESEIIERILEENIITETIIH